MDMNRDTSNLERAGHATHNRTGDLKPIPKTREQRLRAAKRLPQAVVKVASYASGRNRVRATVRYVAREGGLQMEDEAGLTLTSWEEIEEVLDSWEQEFGQQAKVRKGMKGRDSMHLVLSAPKDSDRQAVERAIRDFAAEQFAHNHQYLFTLHHDTAHPHGHVVINARGFDGKYLRTNKETLHDWREKFAETCREHGIEVDASSRLSRGVGERGRSLTLIKTAETLKKKGLALKADASQMIQGIADELKPWEVKAKAITQLEKLATMAEAREVVKDAGIKSGEERQSMESAALALMRHAQTLNEPLSKREQALQGSKEISEPER